MKTGVGVLGNQLVAGTVMLNAANGDKRFLVKKYHENFEFVKTHIDEDLTSLACILKELKSHVMMDVDTIDLLELTNIEVNSKKVPLFVFEVEETATNNQIAENYVWETPNILRNVLKEFQISGVPIFE